MFNRLLGPVLDGQEIAGAVEPAFRPAAQIRYGQGEFCGAQADLRQREARIAGDEVVSVEGKPLRLRAAQCVGNRGEKALSQAECLGLGAALLRQDSEADGTAAGANRFDGPGLQFRRIAASVFSCLRNLYLGQVDARLAFMRRVVADPQQPSSNSRTERANTRYALPLVHGTAGPGRDTVPADHE